MSRLLLLESIFLLTSVFWSIKKNNFPSIQLRGFEQQVTQISKLCNVTPAQGLWGDVLSKLLHKFLDLTLPILPSLIQETTVANYIIIQGPPIVELPRRLVGERLRAARAEFELLLKQVVMRPLDTQWDNPLYLVQKGNDSWRATSDYCKLNAITHELKIYFIMSIKRICFSRLT